LKRARLLAFSAFVLAGCRGILGIENLTVDEDASVASEDAAVQDGGTDATIRPKGDASIDSSVTSSADAPHDTSSSDRRPPADGPPPGADAGECADAGTMCPACCRMNNGPAVAILEGYAIEAGCICTGASTCTTACDGSVCSGVFNPTPGTCAMCIDPLIGPSALCANEGPVGQCMGEPSCNPYLTCLGGCPPP
jgi:hypothetical protein